MSRLPVTLGVAAGVVILDQVTKALAVQHLEGRVPVEVLGPLLRLNFVRNPGAAFSVAGNATILISIIAIAVTMAIVRTARSLASTWWAVVLGGVLGGALGNLLDRLLRAPGPLRGEVVDFLELPNWPVFNVADMALVGSAILAVILSIAGVNLVAEKAPVAEQGAFAQEDLIRPAQVDLGTGVGQESQPPAPGSSAAPDSSAAGGSSAEPARQPAPTSEPPDPAGRGAP